MVGETGSFLDAAVEGLISWEGEGWRFMDAVCMVDARSIAESAIIEVNKLGTAGNDQAGNEIKLSCDLRFKPKKYDE